MIWTFLGIAVGVAAAFCILASFLLVKFPVLDQWRLWIAAVFALLGVAGWFHGRHKARQRAALPPDEAEAVWPPSDKRFQGIMLVVFAFIVLFIQPLFGRKAPPPASAPVMVRRPPPPELDSNPPPVQPPPPVVSPATFPNLKLQGVILRANVREAIINGHSYGIGDAVEGAVLKAVERDHVILEMSGQTRILKLD